MRSRRWSALEVRIWLSAVVVTITLGILWATNVVGSWVLAVGSAIVVIVGLLGYRSEAKRVKRNADTPDDCAVSEVTLAKKGDIRA